MRHTQRRSNTPRTVAGADRPAAPAPGGARRWSGPGRSSPRTGEPCAASPFGNGLVVGCVGPAAPGSEVLEARAATPVAPVPRPARDLPSAPPGRERSVPRWCRRARGRAAPAGPAQPGRCPPRARAAAGPWRPGPPSAPPGLTGRSRRLRKRRRRSAVDGKETMAPRSSPRVSRGCSMPWQCPHDAPAMAAAHGPNHRWGRARPPSSAARGKTASSIGSVSRPVKVFCWLTW